MAAESNLGFHCEGTLGSALDRHAISFQSSALSSVSEMIPMGSYFGMNTITNSVGDAMLAANSSLINSKHGVFQVQTGCSNSSLVLDSVPGLKHDMGFAVEWSVEEQYKLEEGLVKFSSEPSIMKYIKIAATLPDKTVRDVALRCRWMMRKRRKAEESNLGKKVNNRKDKLMESSSTMHMPSASNDMVSAYPFMVDHLDKSDFFHLEVSGINFPARHLLEQNAEAFSQIAVNLSSYKIQDNIDLFHRTRSNIDAILKAMKEMPGMSQMPPLPECINEDLVNILFPNSMQSLINRSSSGMQLKQEPRC